MVTESYYDELIQIPRAVRFPIEMIPPAGFDPERLQTWPVVAGRLEFVEGRLLFMPPCGDLQQYTTTDVVITLGAWVRQNPAFVLGTNEAGMRLGGATRAADAAIWKRSNTAAIEGGLQRTPPLLAVEVAGPDTGDSEAALLDKARWYLSVGVEVVWIVYPGAREIVVVTGDGEKRVSGKARLPAHRSLPGLRPWVGDFFVQIGARR